MILKQAEAKTDEQKAVEEEKKKVCKFCDPVNPQAPMFLTDVSYVTFHIER